MQIRNWGEMGVNMVLASNAGFCPGADSDGSIFASPSLDFATVADNAVDLPPDFSEGWFLVGGFADELVGPLNRDAYPVAD